MGEGAFPVALFQHCFLRCGSAATALFPSSQPKASARDLLPWESTDHQERGSEDFSVERSQESCKIRVERFETSGCRHGRCTIRQLQAGQFVRAAGWTFGRLYGKDLHVLASE